MLVFIVFLLLLVQAVAIGDQSKHSRDSFVVNRGHLREEHHHLTFGPHQHVIVSLCMVLYVA